jgi:hypothetical protein
VTTSALRSTFFDSPEMVIDIATVADTSRSNSSIGGVLEFDLPSGRILSVPESVRVRERRSRQLRPGALGVPEAEFSPSPISSTC